MDKTRLLIDSMSAETLLRKRGALRRSLLERRDLIDVRLAILGGSTTTEVADLLELLLLDKGIRPTIYQSSYNRFFEEAVIDASQLVDFAPHLIYVHTTSANIQSFPQLYASESDLATQVSSEMARFTYLWDSIQDRIGCLVIQNNFEPQEQRLLGNLDAVRAGGRARFIDCVNREFAREAGARKQLLLNDLNSIVASVGLSCFRDPRRWFSYRLVSSPLGSLAISKSVASMIGSVYGRSRKCLVLDLDNTLWGGIIGDDGPDHIKIGAGTPEGEAFAAFQQYCLSLRSKGVILAACSRNQEKIARQGFDHPDSPMKATDFSVFKANWEPKHENIREIAAELNIGLESLVFVDDSPAERDLVLAQLPMVAVPEVGSDISHFIGILEEHRYFETTSLSKEDLERFSQYESEADRVVEQAQHATYDQYLDSLKMVAEIAPFKDIYLERITQLVNKTNQFNLTTKRYTLPEVERIATDPDFVGLYGKLSDRFGDHGLVSVIIGRCAMDVLHLDLWVMSCRVLKRSMEFAMFDSLVAECVRRGIKEIRGYYFPTERNSLVFGHYERLGFDRLQRDNDSEWRIFVSPDCVSQGKHILVREFARA